MTSCGRLALCVHIWSSTSQRLFRPTSKQESVGVPFARNSASSATLVQSPPPPTNQHLCADPEIGPKKEKKTIDGQLVDRHQRGARIPHLTELASLYVALFFLSSDLRSSERNTCACLLMTN